MGILDAIQPTHILAAVADLHAMESPSPNSAEQPALHFGLHEYPASRIVQRALAHTVGESEEPLTATELAPAECGALLVQRGFYVRGMSTGAPATREHTLHILRVLTRIPLPRGQLRLFRLWMDHRTNGAPVALLTRTLSDGDPARYAGLRAALSKRINGTFSQPSDAQPGLDLFVTVHSLPSGSSTERPHEAFWRALETLPDLSRYLEEHPEPWLRDHATEFLPMPSDQLQTALQFPSPPAAQDSFEARFQRFLRWLPGQVISGGRADLPIQCVDQHWIDFAPTETTKRVVLPVDLVREWLQAADEGRIHAEMKKREMREIAKEGSEWAAFHHGFETRLSALVYAWSDFATRARAMPPRKVDLPRAHAAFRDALSQAGLCFGSTSRHDALVRTFLASVLTKRFVILTGLSGSGKSQIAMRFGEWLGPDHARVVAVRPDWTSPEALFGFEDILRKDRNTGRQPWIVPPTLQFILRACESEALHLLVLDEMNLAHVERYFADLLSGMESGKGCIPDVVHDNGEWILRSRKLRPLPENLIIIGTVNVDETTYMFSPKVLDRANTIEFRVTTDDLPDDITAIAPPTDLQPGPAAALAMLHEVVCDRRWHMGRPDHSLQPLGAQLKGLHAVLLRSGFEFGHRVYFEAARFAVIHHALGGGGLHEALDLIILQKLLPRLHGSRRRVGEVLHTLAAYTFFGAPGPHDGFTPASPPSHMVPRLPQSFDKLQRMLAKLDANQFVSFAE